MQNGEHLIVMLEANADTSVQQRLQHYGCPSHDSEHTSIYPNNGVLPSFRREMCQPHLPALDYGAQDSRAHASDEGEEAKSITEAERCAQCHETVEMSMRTASQYSIGGMRVTASQ